MKWIIYNIHNVNNTEFRVTIDDPHSTLYIINGACKHIALQENYFIKQCNG